MRDLTRDHFSLPKLAPAIRIWMDDLNYGRGFVLVRGFPVFDYSKEDAAMAYWAIGRHMGDLVPQSREGDLLGHVRDTGEIATTNPNVRLYKTTKRQDFHTNGSDTILRIERKLEPDVLVMATHGRKGFSHFFLGSVADLVIRGRPAPSLLFVLPNTTRTPWTDG